MTMTRLDLVTDILKRMGDPNGTIWSVAEVRLQIGEGFEQISLENGVFYDWAYAENLPRGFSYTQPWELAYVQDMGGFTLGQANFTAEFERGLIDPTHQTGPANHTSPFEVTDGWVADIGASSAISATADLPVGVAALVRVTWDRRGLDGLRGALMRDVDTRYEVTQGEVYGFMWQRDGVRMLRKVRVPAQACDTVDVTGSWGAMRDPSDLETYTGPAAWGVPRRIPGHHPMLGSFGAPRRPYLDGKNVRAEIFRTGIELRDDQTVCELPDRYALYLRDYVQGKLFVRKGPGQDLKLAKHFTGRWERGLARIRDRVDRVNRMAPSVLGGDGRGLATRPPRPQLPWQFGSRVR